MLQAIIEILKAISGLISPQLRLFVKNALEAWEAYTEKTPNEIDDLIVKFLKAIFAFE